MVQKFGGTSNDAFNDVKCLSNGNYIMVGYYFSSGAKGWIFSLDSGGNQLFSHTIVETTYSIFYSFDILNDGSFIVAGFSSAADSNAYIIKMDSSRGTEWHHTYDESPSNACLQSIVSGPNSNYIACGYLASSQVFYVLMIDIYGSELWLKEYGVAGKVNKCFEVANLQNGNYGAV